MKHLLIFAFYLFPIHLFAQLTVDVSQDTIYFRHATSAERLVYQFNPDASLEEIKVPFPENADLNALSSGVKIRFGSFWVSNSKKIFKKPMDIFSEQQWEAISLPEGLESFSDFDIISGTEAIICGCRWVWAEDYPVNVFARNDVHIIINFQTGAIAKSLEQYDPGELSKYPIDSHFSTQHSWRLFDDFSYIFSLGTKAIIVGRQSGNITVFDAKDGKTRKHKVLSDAQLPRLSDLNDIHERNKKNMEMGQAFFWTGFPIDWVGSLEGDVLLVHRTILGIPDDKPDRPFTAYSFMTLNLNTGNVADEGTMYGGHDAQSSDHALFEYNGQLLSTHDLIAEHEKARKSKQTEEPQLGEDNLQGNLGESR
jgi:hypothetical protein